MAITEYLSEEERRKRLLREQGIDVVEYRDPTRRKVKRTVARGGRGFWSAAKSFGRGVARAGATSARFAGRQAKGGIKFVGRETKQRIKEDVRRKIRRKPVRKIKRKKRKKSRRGQTIVIRVNDGRSGTGRQRRPSRRTRRQPKRRSRPRREIKFF